MLSGKRGGFGAMKPLLRELDADPACELQLVLTDQHLDTKFGATMREVEQEFKVAAAVPLDQPDGSPIERSRALGRCVMRMSDAMASLKPDIVVLYGDRGEVLAAALAATQLGLPIAHLQGGDVSGSLDENFRHALTKLAHLHFPSTEESAERIRRMGEESWRIQVVGDNHIDLIVAGEFASEASVKEALALSDESDILVVLQHSETTFPKGAYAQMSETMEALLGFDSVEIVVIYPCSDPGYEGIIAAIKEYSPRLQAHVHTNLDAPVFWGLMSCASVLIGNSSAGLIETPSFHLPAVNIGRRQSNRLRAENVIDVEHDRTQIRDAIIKALCDDAFRLSVRGCSQPYGDGQAGARVASRLRSVEIDRALLVKQMTY